MDSFQEAALSGGLLPLCITAVLMGIVLWYRRGDAGGALVGAAAVLAVGSAFVTAFLLTSWTAWVPEESWHWLPYLALAAMALGLSFRLPVVIRLLAGLCLAWGAAVLLAPSFLEAEASRWMWLFASCFLGTWLLFEAAMRRHPQEFWGCCWIWILATFAIELMFLGIMMFAQIAVMLCTSVLFFAVMDCKRAWRGMLRFTAPLLALVTVGLIALGWAHTFSTVPISSIVCLGAGTWGCAGLAQVLPSVWGWRRSLLIYGSLLGGTLGGLYLAWQAAGPLYM